MGALLLLDRVARRYGRLPSEVAGLDPVSLGLDIACLIAGESAGAQAVEMIGRSGGMVFPTREV